MKLLQLIYTSCKKGLSTGTGFQTYSMSPGISEEEKRQIERYGLYVPPSHLPTQPGAHEIDSLFPTAFRFFRLGSGRCGICQSKYIGRDYSGRFGNYFSHAIILDSGTFPFYPIGLFNSPLFRTHLTEAEIERDTTPEPLPILELDQAAAGLTINLDDIMEFFSRNNIEPVKQMVSAAMEYDRSHRGLILSHSSQDIPFYIAAIQMAFPLKLVHYLTFSTYSHDPAAVNGIVSGVPRKGSRFAFSDTQRDFDYYIFDEEPPGVVVIEKTYDYTKNVDLGYTISKESLQAFHRFIERFDFHRVDRELDSIDALYRITKVGLEGISQERIVAAVEFANQYASPAVLGQLSDSLHHILASLIENIDYKSAEIVARFLLKIALSSRERKHLETAYHFFFKALDRLIMHNNPPNREAVEMFFNSIRDETKSMEKEFVARVLSENRLKQLTETIKTTRDPLRARIYFYIAVDSAMSLRYTWDTVMQRHPALQYFAGNAGLVLTTSREHLKGAMGTVCRDKDFFTRFISFCLEQNMVNKHNFDTFLHSFIDTLESRTTETAVNIRLALIQRNHEDFVFREYTELLQRSTRRREFFQVYFEKIFSQSPHFLQLYFSPAVDYYLNYLTEIELFQACSAILPDADAITDASVLKRVVNGFEKGVPLSEPDRKNAREIEEKLALSKTLKEKNNIRTSPDITGLALLGIKLEKNAAFSTPLKLSTCIIPGTLSLKQLDTRRVTQFYKWCLPNMVRLAKSPNDHKLLFQWLGDSRLDKMFAVDYITQIKKISKENDDIGLELIQDFMKYFLSSFTGDNSFRLVHEKARACLVKILSSLSNSRFSSIRNHINGSLAVKEKKADSEWKKTLEAVAEKKNKSLLNRIKRIFGKTNTAKPGGKRKKIKTTKKLKKYKQR